jgi:hypothetical protein|tara:strand:- start:1176 stop:1337 length:162 start_codon:yes stop_codon:yes gene_type:complete
MKSKQSQKIQQSLINILLNIMDIEEIVEGKELEGIEDKIEIIKRLVVEIMEEE